MSNDLISRSLLMRVVENSMRNNPHKDWKIKSNHNSEHMHFMDMVARMPVACDEDRMVEQIAKATRPGQPEYYLDGRPVIYKEQAIEIIRSGGRQQDE